MRKEVNFACTHVPFEINHSTGLLCFAFAPRPLPRVNVCPEPTDGATAIYGFLFPDASLFPWPSKSIQSRLHTSTHPLVHVPHTLAHAQAARLALGDGPPPRASAESLSSREVAIICFRSTAHFVGLPIMLDITIKTLQLGDFHLQVPAESSVLALKVQVKVRRKGVKRGGRIDEGRKGGGGTCTG